MLVSGGLRQNYFISVLFQRLTHVKQNTETNLKWARSARLAYVWLSGGLARCKSKLYVYQQRWLIVPQFNQKLNFTNLIKNFFLHTHWCVRHCLRRNITSSYMSFVDIMNINHDVYGVIGKLP